jgi:hypothetical protein
MMVKRRQHLPRGKRLQRRPNPKSKPHLRMALKRKRRSQQVCGSFTCQRLLLAVLSVPPSLTPATQPALKF